MSIIESMIDIPVEHEKRVCGQFDCHLKKIERTLHVSIIARDGEIKIIGPDHAVRKARSVFNTLLELSKRGEEIGEQNVDYALALSFEGKDGELLEIDRGYYLPYHQRQAGKTENIGPEAVHRPDPDEDDRLRRGTGGYGKNVSWYVDGDPGL